MNREIKRGNCSLKLSGNTFSIIDPRGFLYNVDVDFSDDSHMIYTSKVEHTLFTGSSPIELLEQVANSFNVREMESPEYTNGFYDGVASINREVQAKSYDDGFEKGYKKAIGDCVAIMTNKGKEFKRPQRY